MAELWTIPNTVGEQDETVYVPLNRCVLPVPRYPDTQVGSRICELGGQIMKHLMYLSISILFLLGCVQESAKTQDSGKTSQEQQGQKADSAVLHACRWDTLLHLEPG